MCQKFNLCSEQIYINITHHHQRFRKESVGISRLCSDLNIRCGDLVKIRLVQSQPMGLVAVNEKSEGCLITLPDESSTQRSAIHPCKSSAARPQEQHGYVTDVNNHQKPSARYCLATCFYSYKVLQCEHHCFHVLNKSTGNPLYNKPLALMLNHSSFKKKKKKRNTIAAF